MSSVFSPKDIRGQKDKQHPLSELEKCKTDINLKFRQIKDGGFAEYQTKKSNLKVKTWLRQVDKTSLFDGLGNPAYIIRTESEVLIEPKIDSSKKGKES